jgi:hypothetical protein
VLPDAIVVPVETNDASALIEGLLALVAEIAPRDATPIPSAS